MGNQPTVVQRPDLLRLDQLKQRPDLLRLNLLCAAVHDPNLGYTSLYNQKMVKYCMKKNSELNMDLFVPQVSRKVYKKH